MGSLVGRLINCVGSVWIVGGLVGLSVYCVIRWLEEKRQRMKDGAGGGSMAMAMATMGDSMIGFLMMVLAVTVALGFMYDWRAVVMYVFFAFWAVMLAMIRGVRGKAKGYQGVFNGTKKFEDVYVRVQ